MTEYDILFLMMGILVLDYIIEFVLGYLNQKSSAKPIPEVLSGIYSDEAYTQSQDYQGVNYRFSLISGTLSLVGMLLILYFGVFGSIDQWIRSFAPNELLLSLYFFGVVYFLSDFISIPFSLYRTFVIEEKFGFNKSTLKTWLLDKLKGYLITIIVGGILMSVLILLVFAYGGSFWWWFWGVISLFMVVMSLFYTSWILPLFNTLTPLADGELRNAIEAYAKKVDFPLTNIFVIDGSKRSSKANAFFSGFGKNKKIVLYDTLIEKHSTEELVAILAHEVGHYKKKHVVGSMILGILQTGFMLYLLSVIILNAEVSWAMGGQVSAMHLNLLAFGILYTPISNILGILMHVLSRKNEFEADAFAIKTFKKLPLQSALKKLSGDHLSNLTPHPAYVFVHYSHPPLVQRVEAMDKVAEG